MNPSPAADRPACPPAVLELVARFDAQRDSYRGPAYNETQVRREFIDPFFVALGWDVDNRAGLAEAYKDVIHEDAIKVGGATKAPDYCFRIGGARKFFVEAKKPAVGVADDPGPAYQVCRYAWSSKLPLSIVTDFEEFAVYDCRIRPSVGDKASTARILYCTCDQYAAKWGEIASIFSKDAILKGAFDRFAESTARKRGTAQVDDAFLAEIEGWRDALARNLALRNPELSERGLNFAVGRIIDRLIFLRMCEDRGIETYAQLRALLNGEAVYSRFMELCRRADERYNSGLFHFEREKDRREPPDELTPGLSLDDQVLKDILRSLYYPDSPYEFSVLPAEILGQVYEQFLGKVIRLTKGHRAVVEEKPEVRKAGGVYYTPAYIVDYIVKNTVGKLLGDVREGEAPAEPCSGPRPRAAVHSEPARREARPPITPEKAAKLRILDPACGSGSFLLGAYQYLLDWHRDWYVQNGPEKHTTGRHPRLYQRGGLPGGGAEWGLTTAERKRILLNNIHGVDIDPQAVEVTKLSLLLKVLEGETGETLARQLRLFHERALPDLASNIKCGNSLIGSDFYAHEQLSLLDEDARLRINVFDWDGKEGFPEIMKSGGFDAVIGNPPYVRQEILGPEFKLYAKTRFKSFSSSADLYVYFIERSHQLLRDGGFFGMITSNKFMRAQYGRSLREFLASRVSLRQLLDFGELKVFQNASTFPLVILTEATRPKKQRFTYAAIKRLDFTSLDDEVAQQAATLDDRSMQGTNWTLATEHEQGVLEKLKAAGLALCDYLDCPISFGVKTGCNEAFVVEEEYAKTMLEKHPTESEFIRPLLIGDDIRRYRARRATHRVILIPKGWSRSHGANRKSALPWLRSVLPSIAEHLGAFEAIASGRLDQGEFWWEHRACDYLRSFSAPKIVYPIIAKESRLCFDSGNHLTNDKTFIIPKRDLYLLGVLNSRLAWLFFKRTCSVLGDPDRGGRLDMRSIFVGRLPIRRIDFSNPDDKAKHDRMVALVEQMLSLHQSLSAAKSPHEKEALRRQIDATDRRIDRLVYDLYGLTADEIKIVEEATP